MLSLNVTQRTEDYGSSLKQEQSNETRAREKKNRYSELLVDECIFVSIFFPDLEKPSSRSHRLKASPR